MNNDESEKYPANEQLRKALSALPPEILLAAVSEREGESAASSKTSVEITEQFSGPLPHPNVLREYESIAPGAAERVIAMAEKEQQHRNSLEGRYVDGPLEAIRRGQLIAGAVSLAAILAGAVAMFLDKDVYGIAAILGGLSPIVLGLLLRNSALGGNESKKEQALNPEV